MGQDAVAVLNQRQAVLANGAAHLDVLIPQLQGPLPQTVLDRRHRAAGMLPHHLRHLLQSPRQIDRGGPGADQIGPDALKLRGKGLVIRIRHPPAHRIDADGRRHTNGRGTAHLQGIDCLIDGFRRRQPQNTVCPGSRV